MKLTLSAANDPQPQPHPNGRAYDLKVMCDPPLEFAIKFRLPWWIKRAASLTLNGEGQNRAGGP